MSYHHSFSAFLALVPLLFAVPSAGAAPGDALLRATDPQTGWITSLQRGGDTNRLEFLRAGQ
jgi:hypothetical protein